MYVALFLAPWVAGYALSTLLMSHQRVGPQNFLPEDEMPFAVVFPADTTPQEQGRQILETIDLQGAFSVQGPAADGRLTINRQSILTPRLITYRPAEQRLTIEKGEFSTSAFLGRFHRRRGYQSPYLPDQAMALSVDAVVAAMVFWSLSGVSMWWEMRVTRRWGMVCLLVGMGGFGAAVWWL